MFGWLQKKSENARVYMCVKELKWDLETASEVRRAKILAMAQLLRGGFSDIEAFEDAIDNPFDYPREQVAFLYSEMENMRNGATLQLNHLEKSFRNMGMDFPEEWKNHVKLTNRAIEVWMTLFGCGMAPDVRDDVREIWRYLLGSKSQLATAMSELREMSREQAQITGTDIFDEFGHSDEEWAEMCEFTPNKFTKTLF